PGDIGGDIAVHPDRNQGEGAGVGRELLGDSELDAAFPRPKLGVVADQRDRSWASGLRHGPIVIRNRRRRPWRRRWCVRPVVLVDRRGGVAAVWCWGRWDREGRRCGNPHEWRWSR